MTNICAQLPHKKLMKPQKVDDLDMVFGARAMELLPPWNSIPHEFKEMNRRHPWHEEVDRIFFKGGSTAHWKAKDGINRNEAIRHFKAVIGSFDPKHEHKTAGLAYLLDQWFILGQPQEVKS